jgi:hypothetical protein
MSIELVGTDKIKQMIKIFMMKRRRKLLIIGDLISAIQMRGVDKLSLLNSLGTSFYWTLWWCSRLYFYRSNSVTTIALLLM